mmetsp:Transcript_42337/g.99376  ORF Transcript_42337/g.99376 Transcript_42337/m.99376 type:complete len:451 (-) Transcript_42337:3-1355(-)
MSGLQARQAVVQARQNLAWKSVASCSTGATEEEVTSIEVGWLRDFAARLQNIEEQVSALPALERQLSLQEKKLDWILELLQGHPQKQTPQPQTQSPVQVEVASADVKVSSQAVHEEITPSPSSSTGLFPVSLSIPVKNTQPVATKSKSRKRQALLPKFGAKTLQQSPVGLAVQTRFQPNPQQQQQQEEVEAEKPEEKAEELPQGQLQELHEELPEPGDGLQPSTGGHVEHEADQVPVENREFDGKRFAMQVYFDTEVRKLELEIDWDRYEVGAVKPGGEAEQRGLLVGDRILECNGIEVSGKPRSEILPMLKARPLLLKVAHKPHAAQDQERPFMEMQLKVQEISHSAMGTELTWSGQLPIVVKVQEDSPMYKAGILPGDAVPRINRRSTESLSRAAVQSALRELPLVVTIWRMPLGLEKQAPWLQQPVYIQHTENTASSCNSNAEMDDA